MTNMPVRQGWSLNHELCVRVVTQQIDVGACNSSVHVFFLSPSDRGREQTGHGDAATELHERGQSITLVAASLAEPTSVVNSVITH
jgi:hypothetical protein